LWIARSEFLLALKRGIRAIAARGILGKIAHRAFSVSGHGVGDRAARKCDGVTVSAARTLLARLALNNNASAADTGAVEAMVGSNGVVWVAIIILVGTGALVIARSKSVFAFANLFIAPLVDTSTGNQAEDALKRGAAAITPKLGR